MQTNRGAVDSQNGLRIVFDSENISLRYDKLNTAEQKKIEICSSFPRLLIWGSVLPVFYLWLEAVVRIFIFQSFGLSYLCFVLPFCIALGLFLCGACSLLPPTGERIAVRIVMGISCLIYTVHILYFRFFNAFFAWEMMGNGQALSSFWRETLLTALRNWYVLLLIWLPFIAYCVFSSRILCGKTVSWPSRGIVCIIAAAGMLTSVLYVRADNAEYGNRYYHGAGFSMSEGVDRFGLTDATFTDLCYFLFGRPQDKNADLDSFMNETTVDPSDIFAWEEVTSTSDTASASPETTSPQETTSADTQPSEEDPPETGPNALDIDFETLINTAPNADVAEMHRYFSSLTPTEKNEYTGLFQGKNLIYITAEGLCGEFIDPVLTPTLYKMANGGFVLENFYNSAWGGSTATGEYANMTGLFYYYGCSPGAGQIWNTVGDRQIYLPFTMGNMLKAQGYVTYAFHNYLYNYYGRAGSHPLMGYEWIAKGNGLDGLTNSWPASDLEMADLTLPYFINSDQPFHVYYMTVSGHGYYGWNNNAMSRKNRERVQNLSYSEEVKAYIASQLEFEDMLTRLVDALDEKGILEDTVFVISADHYPYSLSADALMELYGLEGTQNLDAEFDLYRNVGIIWCASMEEPVHIQNPCSTIDLLPTVLNLFGCNYDSRLLMGTDLLSDAEPLVILCQNGRGTSWNWINRYGSYSTATRTFTASEGVTFDSEKIDAYVKRINQVVALKKKYAPMIIYQNYYNYLRDAIEAAQ